jgi:hypothetical protein
MSVPALYELVGQFRRLAVLAEHEELPPEVIRDCLEALEGNLQIKSTNIIKFVLGLEAEADTIDAAAEQMKLRALRRRRRAESIRAYVLLSLQAAGVTRVECPEFTIAVRKNPEAVEIADQKTVPAEFMVTPPAPPAYPDKKKIADSLKAYRELLQALGEGQVAPPSPVPGAWLKQGERLEVRT